MGGCSIDRYGTALTDETLAACQAAGAVLLGAVGGPKWDDPKAAVRPEQGLLALRKGLGVFANLRPVKVYPQLVDTSPLRPEKLAGVDLVYIGLNVILTSVETALREMNQAQPVRRRR